MTSETISAPPGSVVWVVTFGQANNALGLIYGCLGIYTTKGDAQARAQDFVAQRRTVVRDILAGTKQRAGTIEETYTEKRYEHAAGTREIIAATQRGRTVVELKVSVKELVVGREDGP